MGKPISTKDLGKESTTGLQVIMEVFKINIDTDLDQANIEFRLNYISPTGVPIKTTIGGYTRFNRPEEKYRISEIITPAEYYPLGTVITPEVLYAKGDIITPAVTEAGEEVIPAVIATGTEVKIPALIAGMLDIKTPAVISDGTQVKIAANMKFDALRNSTPGQMIAGLIGADLDLIKSFETIMNDISQN